MGKPIAKIIIGIATLLVVAVGAALVGRVSADAGRARSDGYHRGYQAGSQAGYYQALPVGEAEGRRTGRVLQEGSELPAKDRQPVTDAFNAGYAAGANDAFAGYDGGWTLQVPYLVVIAAGRGDIVYRILTRDPVEAATNYYLCPDGHHLCQEPRH
jgi:hypothetical protein